MQQIDRRQLLIGTALAAAVGSATVAAVDQPESGERASGGAAPDLSGRSILITGTSSGFGHAGALYYARHGAKVIASMRNMPRPEAIALEDTARRERLDLRLVEIDVLSDQQVARGVAEAERIAGGALDVLVNNAGVGIGGPVELQDLDAARLIFETNVLGYHRMMRAVLPAMRARRRGLIINVSSQLGRVVIPNFGLYPATKFAVEAMSEQLSLEVAPHGIDVSIIEPGGYPTQIWAKSRKLSAALIARTPSPLRAAYPPRASGVWDSAGGSADVMDVPRAIAEIIAMPAGSRPLRRPVQPG